MSDDAEFAFYVEERSPTLRVRLEGELDLITEPALVDAFIHALVGTAASTIVLDVRQVGFIDSSGLRALLLCRDHAARHGVGFALKVSPGPVTGLLKVAGVKDWFAYA